MAKGVARLSLHPPGESAPMREPGPTGRSQGPLTYDKVRSPPNLRLKPPNGDHLGHHDVRSGAHLVGPEGNGGQAPGGDNPHGANDRRGLQDNLNRHCGKRERTHPSEDPSRPQAS